MLVEATWEDLYVGKTGQSVRETSVGNLSRCGRVESKDILPHHTAMFHNKLARAT